MKEEDVTGNCRKEIGSSEASHVKISHLLFTAVIYMGRPVETIKTLKLISKIMLQISRR